MSNITIKNAYLRYDQQVIFDGLNVSLPLRQWTCLLGPSGVGKSTLLKLLAGLTNIGKDDELNAEILAPDIINLAKDIAYMAQEDGLLPWLSVLENVTIGSKLRDQSVDKDRARVLLKQVGLDDVEEKRPEKLSGGMRQRVALVRTLYEDKKVVLMDEPFSALDAITRLRLQEMAVKLLHDKTVLLITHDPLEALRVGDGIYVMTGQPANLGELITPNGTKPRDLEDEEILKLQGKLLKELEQKEVVNASA